MKRKGWFMAGPRRLPTLSEKVNQVEMEMLAKALPSFIKQSNRVYSYFADTPQPRTVYRNWGAKEC